MIPSEGAGDTAARSSEESHVRATSEIPVHAEDIYAPEAVADPYPAYARLRELGPVVRLPKHKVLALPRYAESKAVLLDPETFISGDGVGLNAISNRLSRGTTLNSDGPAHAERRALLAHRLTPRALRGMRGDVERQAVDVVEAALRLAEVDGVRDIATALPLSIVPDLVGWPREGREHLLRWAGATFDSLGPINKQAVRTAPAALGMMRFSRQVVRKRALSPGSMGAEVLAAADAGRIAHSDCPALMIDYLAPSLDTTISAIASGLALFARHPEQWDLLRADPSRIPNAVNEIVRLESPLRAFSRKVARDTTLAGHRLRAGERVLVMFASANRDASEWSSPDTFDITRDASRQLGFGHGAHGCAGQGLARLETQAVLGALLDRVERIELAGEPVRAPNNIIHGYARLPLRLVAKDGRA